MKTFSAKTIREFGDDVKVIANMLSDGSIAYDVRWLDLIFGCTSRPAAVALAKAIHNGAAWVQISHVQIAN